MNHDEHYLNGTCWQVYFDYFWLGSIGPHGNQGNGFYGIFAGMAARHPGE